MNIRPPKIGISSCLLGYRVRYDGGHVRDHYISDTLGKYVEWMPICPEVECGLSVPREAMRLVGADKDPRLVASRSGKDHTERMKKWIEKKIPEIKEAGLDGFIFKSKSPSSGIGGVKIYSERGMPVRKGAGIFGGAVTRAFPLMPCEDDGRLHNPNLRENFIERVLVYSRWNDYMKTGISIRGLVDFHTCLKFLVMAHSPRHYGMLGRMVADAKKAKLTRLHEDYINLLMEGLKLLATVKKNANVLHHVMGYFKKNITSGEKSELLEIIDNYHKGFVPLVVPVTLLNHHARKYDEKYLKEQFYLKPHPAELMLRNHV